MLAVLQHRIDKDIDNFNFRKPYGLDSDYFDRELNDP